MLLNMKLTNLQKMNTLTSIHYMSDCRKYSSKSSEWSLEQSVHRHTLQEYGWHLANHKVHAIEKQVLNLIKGYIVNTAPG